MVWLECVPAMALCVSLVTSEALLIVGEFHTLSTPARYFTKFVLVTQLVLSAVGLVALNLLPMVD